MMKHNRGCQIKNMKEAIVWIEKAANQNYPLAQLLMSNIHRNSEFIKQGYELGDYWMHKIDSHHLEKAINNSFKGF
jgi:TPR repeat protein